MDNCTLIKMALAYAKMTQANLATALDTSTSAFSQRLKTGKFTPEEMQKIAQALGAEYKSVIVFPDGTHIG